MGKYTTEVRSICESYAGLIESVGYGKVDEIISKARGKVFDFNYPIFDEAYRSVLETKILKHFYTKEIGAETVGLWKLWLNTRMNEIMPYYNKLYNSELLEFNPLYDVDITKDYKLTKDGEKVDTSSSSGSGNSSSSGETTSKKQSLYSDTPQGGISGLTNLEYLTNATINDGETESSDSGESSYSSESSTSSVIDNVDDYLEHVNGKPRTSFARKR